MWVLGIAATFCGLFLFQGFALQIQCYQCEEFQLNNDCSSPEFIVNCTVNVQDMCQKEVMEQSAGAKHSIVWMGPCVFTSPPGVLGCSILYYFSITQNHDSERGGRCKQKHCLQTPISEGSPKASCTGSRVHLQRLASSPRPGTSPSAPLGN
ncbi:ly6/PLAUR domain-containing protein 1 isoform X2 [Lutra lutra]|uniref:ly6/PLAUR domain-containing protein 1 isoform X2 n=1 Tax=Lutra lutra TaxID=9657 RepID=UPI001FD31F48|nr:ly6/PLAUR domain-containing protein 1 isoform X2 [Lutra lutra]